MLSITHCQEGVTHTHTASVAVLCAGTAGWLLVYLSNGAWQITNVARTDSIYGKRLHKLHRLKRRVSLSSCVQGLPGGCWCTSAMALGRSPTWHALLAAAPSTSAAQCAPHCRENRAAQH